MLNIDKNWRFRSPGEAPREISFALDEVIHKIANQGNRKAILETFKSYFAGATGATAPLSSDEGWAASDLSVYMEGTRSNSALFIAAFYDACECISLNWQNIHLPDIDYINSILATSKSGFLIAPPNLVKTDHTVSVEVVPPPIAYDAKMKQVIQNSINTAQTLLNECNNRQAVGESLWLLESIINGFKGVELSTGIIKGKYFRPIISSLKQSDAQTSLPIILAWVETLHGYLSAPTGGGVRHGRDLKEGLEMSTNEARLYYNLTQSYVSYLMAEYARISENAKFGS